jgi:hypothetical protein
MMHDYFMNPGGGNPLYDDPMLGWGIIGMDIGLAFFGQGLVNRMGKFRRRQLQETPRRMSKRGLILNYGQEKWKGKPLEMLSRPSGQRGALGPAKTEMLRQTAAKDAMRKSIAARKNYASWGRNIKRLGIATAALGLLDLGFSLFYEMSSPGVDRETLERDRQQVFSNEGMLDTRMAYTQRQRAIQAIHDSQLSVGRAMLGQEAAHLHR